MPIEKEMTAFVKLGPTLLLVGPEGTPRLAVTIEGRPEAAAFAEAVAIGIGEWVDQNSSALTVVEQSDG